VKVVLFREHGGPEKLSYEEMPRPQIGPEEVLIWVKACALNYLDIWVREGESCLCHSLPQCI
jgi:NADPH:quinone reductase-like Zn-dependent oxidoreductase